MGLEGAEGEGLARLYVGQARCLVALGEYRSATHTLLRATPLPYPPDTHLRHCKDTSVYHTTFLLTNESLPSFFNNPVIIRKPGCGSVGELPRRGHDGEAVEGEDAWRLAVVT